MPGFAPRPEPEYARLPSSVVWRSVTNSYAIISVSVRGYGAIMAFSIQLRGGAVIARGADKIRDYGYDEHGNRGYQR